MDIDQLNEELNDGFTTVWQLQMLSLVISYQQFAIQQGLEMSWAADRLIEQALTLEREMPKLRKPQFGEAFAQNLRVYAEQIRGTDGPPSLTLIEGGKNEVTGLST